MLEVLTNLFSPSTVAFVALAVAIVALGIALQAYMIKREVSRVIPMPTPVAANRTQIEEATYVQIEEEEDKEEGVTNEVVCKPEEEMPPVRKNNRMVTEFSPMVVNKKGKKRGLKTRRMSPTTTPTAITTDPVSVETSVSGNSGNTVVV
tara:strand:- start:713 stop:1159 length:447 start_codon:yes stop_codon:yes gene_type:complete